MLRYRARVRASGQRCSGLESDDEPRLQQLEVWLERIAGQRKLFGCLQALIRPADPMLELPLSTLCAFAAGASLGFALWGKADADELSGELLVRLCGIWLIAEALGERDMLAVQLDRTEHWLEGAIYGRRLISSRSGLGLARGGSAVAGVTERSSLWD